MNFEELETLWGAQQPPADRPTDLATLKRRLRPELRRRSRFFAYEIFCLTLGLVLTPVLAVANSRYAAPDNPAVYWLRAILVVTVTLGFLVAAIRRLRRHRALARADTSTLATFAAQSLANIDAEIHDYRMARWALWLWTGLTLFSIWLNARAGWTPFASRAGAVLLFAALFAWLIARHHRKNLAPERARRKQMLEELS